MSVQYRIAGTWAAEIVTDVENAVQDGLLAPGERLPSVRALASQLSVSPGTVAAAFAELRRRGVVVTQKRDATRVSDRPPLGAPLPTITIRPGTRDLATGNPDPALLPDLPAALTAVARTITTPRLYDADASLIELVELAHDEVARAGMPSDEPVDGVVLSGALDAVDRALAAAIAPGSRVAVEDPGYDSLLGLVRARGYVPVPMGIDQEGPTAESLHEALFDGAKAVVITARGQNPTGAAVTAERAAQLADVLLAFPDVLVIENDHLGAIAGVPLVSVAGRTHRWVHVRSFAKSLGPDLRVAAVLGDARTVGRVRGQQALGPGWVSEVLQRLVLELMRAPATVALLRHATDTYSTRRAALVTALKSFDLQAAGASGFNVWVPVPDETVAVTALLDAGWATAPGSRYRQNTPPGIRITASTLTADEAPSLAHTLHGVARGGFRRTA